MKQNQNQLREVYLMGIFQRLSDLLKSNINDLIDKAEDPEKMVKQIIIDMAMERTLVNAKTTIQELKLKIKKLEKENAELREELARVRKISKV